MTKNYLILRAVFFWLFIILFITVTPLSILYSLGYKFDKKIKKFAKTGAVVIHTEPPGTEIYLNNEKIKDITPDVLEGILPGHYVMGVRKEGFYPYEVPLEVVASRVKKMDIVLVPKIEDAQRLDSQFNIYNFFVIKSLLAQQIVAFTDTGIYLLNLDLGVRQKISNLVFDRTEAISFKNLKENNARILFWNKKSLWMINVAQAQTELGLSDKEIYKAKDTINEVFFGLKGRYLIICDGLKIIALDSENPEAYFEIFTLINRQAKVFYDSDTDTLYIKDVNKQSGMTVLSKINMNNVVFQEK